MRFKTFLESQWTHSKMEFVDMMEWIENNAPKFISREQHIFRGVYSDDAEGLYNGSNLNRKAAYANNNYYNLWLSNHRHWAEFPRRDKSFICSTDEGKASEYGDVYYVIPQDNSLIGVCPRSDIWDSFKDIPMVLGAGHTSNGVWSNVSTFSDCVDDIFKNVLGHSVPDDDWDVFEKFAESISMLDILEKCRDEWFFKSWYKYMKDNNTGDLETMLTYILDPTRNGFKLEKAANFVAYENREVWMSGAALFVNEETHRQIMSEFK